ncbi:hypothetical protein MTR_7g022730 [Medicago truncatula]|uniref:Uncharacterized protein n=1 Tax=Medicago truncatula TaxID=3880 RepID=G7KVM6_MEDTR|nr:hypothetical protein MTR_7g022730 [Medicago truncatula]
MANQKTTPTTKFEGSTEVESDKVAVWCLYQGMASMHACFTLLLIQAAEPYSLTEVVIEIGMQ